jgi:hypothetical protein
MPDTPLGLISTDNLFRLAAIYCADVNDAKRSGDEEAEKRLSAKEAEIIAELERRGAIRDKNLRSLGRNALTPRPRSVPASLPASSNLALRRRTAAGLLRR